MNKYITDEQSLRTILVPAETSTYKPVSHGEIIDVTRQAIASSPFQIVGEQYRASSAGLVATGFYDLSYNGDKELGIRVAWQNSYNKQVSLKFVIGTVVFVCENGAFFGNMGAFRKKHVGEIQKLTPTVVNEYIESADEIYIEMSRVKELMKNVVLDKEQQSHLLGEMYVFADLIPERLLPKLRTQILTPAHDYKCDNCLWQFYNNVTYAYANLHPTTYLDYHSRLHDFITKKYNL